MASVIRAGFSTDKPRVTLRLIEDQDGKRLALPDGRIVAGVVTIALDVSPGELTKMTLVLVDFEVDMNCPSRGSKHDG